MVNTNSTEPVKIVGFEVDLSPPARGEQDQPGDTIILTGLIFVTEWRIAKTVTITGLHCTP